MTCTLRLIKARFLFLLTLILFSSFATLVYSQKGDVFSDAVSISSNSSLAISTPLAFGTLLDKPTQLNQSTRIEIYDFIQANPGVHFRGICKLLNLPIGVAQYHLGLLMKAGMVSSFRDGRYTRYFQSGKFEEREMKIVSLLRHETARKVLSIVLKKPSLSHIDLASKLGVSSQALTWHINRLRKTGLISFVTEGTKVRYSLDEDNAEMIKLYLDFIK